MTQILSGAPISDQIAQNLALRVSTLSTAPVLVIISIGSRSDTEAFIRAKQKYADRIGVVVRRIELLETVTQEQAEEAIRQSALDKTVHGIILQLPVPAHLNSSLLIACISSSKDVDGLTADNLRLLLEGCPYMVPATARGIINLLDAYDIKIEGARVVVVGRSVLVGKSIALVMLARNATATICHTKTRQLSEVTRQADILISATGSARSIGIEHVKAGQVVIDVGITAIGELVPATGKRILVGDVDFSVVEPIVSAITPVPGGVGPMTVSALFQNAVEVAERAMQPIVHTVIR